MAGDRWLLAMDAFGQIDLGKIESAAKDWWAFGGTLAAVEGGFGEARAELRYSGLVAEVGDRLDDATLRTGRALLQTIEELGTAARPWYESFFAPSKILERLATYIRSVHQQMLELADGDGPGGGFPMALSPDPDLRLLQEVRRGQYDELADQYVADLQEEFGIAARSIGRVSLRWPETLPQADPAADLGALGVPTGPR